MIKLIIYTWILLAVIGVFQAMLCILFTAAGLVDLLKPIYRWLMLTEEKGK